MGSQRTKANIYKAGYRKTRAALQEQQKINAAIASTLDAQKAVQAPTMQQTVAQTPVVQQLRSTSLNNPMVTKASTTNTATPVSVVRGKANPQGVQVKQKLTTPGMPSTPKVNTSTTTMVRKGNDKGKQTSTISVLDTIQDEGEYSVEVEGEEFEDSDSDATELHEILANITEPEETNLELEPELDPPI